MEYRDFLPSDKPAVAICCSNCSHCRKSGAWTCKIGDPLHMAHEHGWCDRFSISKPAVQLMIRRFRKKQEKQNDKESEKIK